MPSILSVLIALFGVYRYGPWWLRAIQRRRRPAVQGEPPLDPWIAVWFRVLLWIYASAIVAASLVPLWLYAGWPRWVGLGGLYLSGGLALVQFIVIAPLAIRIALEEKKFSSNAQVT